MAQGDAASTDVPGKYDVVLNGKGYQLLDSIEPSLPFRSHRATYSQTPTFLTRTNVSGAWGDNQQAFWLTATQNDWSLGEGQFYYRLTDPVSIRRAYSIRNCDIVTLPGQASLLPAVTSVTTSGNVLASCATAISGVDPHAFVYSASLVTVASNGTTTNQGAHGAGTPVQWGMCSDGVNVYISGATSIRKWNGSAFSSFSATTSAGSLATLNNALYSCDGSTLKTYSGTGTATTLYTWKDNTNTALATSAAKIIPYGGKLLIFFPRIGGQPELWIYDGTGTSKVAELPRSAIGYDVAELLGVVFMSGMVTGSNTGGRPTIWYWDSGSIGKLWESNRVGFAAAVNSIYQPALGTFGGRLVFTEGTNGYLKQYDLGSGAVQTIGSYSLGGNTGTQDCFLTSDTTGSLLAFNAGGGSPNAALYPDTTSFASSGVIQTSQVDYDNSLTKSFHGIKVVWTGSGTVDIAYAVDNLGFNSYTSLQTGATSGTEYALPAGTTGNSITVQVTLNRGSVNTGPTVTRVYVRAAPVQEAFRTREYVLDLSGIGFKDPVQLNDGAFHPLSGHEQASNLITLIGQTAPFSVTDRFATFTGICDPANCEIYEIREGNDSPQFSGGFAAKITVREV